ncbi:uncharacterized protein C8Q71DRAFT_762972 [Rhodofomes roseus]|uniref:DUF1764-domain-containing protein n=1 Tax=Rhodofomes roseus TaxID=34475 RepID=A0ABQ8KEQ2_9APHY|nr:uncharacterized protein C8Q71DRAFT_762972 [Rhodofomes roseus]KAH9835665.1 hypothetical protein C8Q71DRAFT_762972 [Rhodofomes roseus]
MPPSEIDDIFAAKTPGRAKAPVPVASSSAAEPPKKSKKNKKEKTAKRKRDDIDDSQPAKRRVPETVLDPSVNPTPAANVAVPTSVKAAKLAKLAAAPVATKKKRSKPDKDEETRFKDSRGNGPRQKTEEGYTIYKEDELGMSNSGGDTPLCPFDCDCCF